MKILITLAFFCVFALCVKAQTINPNPIQLPDKSGSGVIGFRALIFCTENGHQRFTGVITHVRQDYQYSVVDFDLPQATFSLGYENISNVGRSYLDYIVRRRNRVAIYACAGGSNGIWDVIDIKVIGRAAASRKK
ncbi:MAG: hypothetical protein INR69_22040 [Mucilaginibacter polytrichastri]|nr:hypothetical protein [Mucilaginibacter polytrichastri]